MDEPRKVAVGDVVWRVHADGVERWTVRSVWPDESDYGGLVAICDGRRFLPDGITIDYGHGLVVLAKTLSGSESAAVHAWQTAREAEVVQARAEAERLATGYAERRDRVLASLTATSLGGSP